MVCLNFKSIGIASAIKPIDYKAIAKELAQTLLKLDKLERQSMISFKKSKIRVK